MISDDYYRLIFTSGRAHPIAMSNYSNMKGCYCWFTHVVYKCSQLVVIKATVLRNTQLSHAYMNNTVVHWCQVVRCILLAVAAWYIVPYLLVFCLFRFLSNRTFPCDYVNQEVDSVWCL